MKFVWDLHELTDFGERIADADDFNEHIAKATQKLAEVFHRMLIKNTPVWTGTLQAFWQTDENYLYIVEQKRSSFTVTLVNRSGYAPYVNDGHRQRPGRFIPGNWVDDKHFQYDPKAEGGMVLRKPFVKGVFFVEKSVLATEEKVDSILNKELKKWFRWCVNGK